MNDKIVGSKEMQNNLYKILRMNIILAKANGEVVTEETLQSFEEITKKIDEEKNQKYEDEVKEKHYKTETLEEEEKRLLDLITIISNRVKERKELLEDYQEVTGRTLDGLVDLTDANALDSYQHRLDNIRKYLENTSQIEKIESELIDLNRELEECYDKKKQDENNNFELEDDLLLQYKNIVLAEPQYANILNVTDFDKELESLKPTVEEAKKTLDTFEKAFANLKKAGISGETEIEYSSYVEDAKKAYYQVKEQEFLIEIYKVLSESKNIYSELSIKRANLNQILEQRSKLRSIIGIFENDILSKLYDMIDEQQKVIKSEKENLDNIEKTTDKIKFKTTKLDNLKEENTSVEILAILKEYGVIETYDTDIIEEEMTVPELSEESVAEPQEVDQNMIVKVEDLPITMNIAFAKSKATTVMKRVGRTLGFISKPEVPKPVINEVVTPVEEAPKPVLEPITLPTMEEPQPVVTQPNIEMPINKEVEIASNNNVVETLETKDLFPSVETPQPVDTKNIFPAIEAVQTVEANNIFPTSEPIQTMDTNSIFPTIEPAPATVKAPEEKADTTPVMPEMPINIPTIKPLEQTPNVQVNTMNINAEPVVSPVMPQVTNSQPSSQSFWPSMTNNNPEPVAPTQPIMPEIPKKTVIPTGEYNLNTTGPGTIVTNLKIGEEK